MLTRKLWNKHAFKGQVSPHELVQQVSKDSSKRFDLSKTADPLDFLAWFLNKLHAGLLKEGSKLVHELFQGRVTIESQRILGLQDSFDETREIMSQEIPFLYLTLTLPPSPIFQSESDQIPQVSLTTLLKKYDGSMATEVDGLLRRFSIKTHPPFLILHIKRFTKSPSAKKTELEHNPTIVSFNTDSPTIFRGVPYRLVANVCACDGGGWKAVLRGERGEWVEVCDLVVGGIIKEMIWLGESYLQVWGRE